MPHEVNRLQAYARMATLVQCSRLITIFGWLKSQNDCRIWVDLSDRKAKFHVQKHCSSHGNQRTVDRRTEVTTSALALRGGPELAASAANHSLCKICASNHPELDIAVQEGLAEEGQNLMDRLSVDMHMTLRALMRYRARLPTGPFEAVFKELLAEKLAPYGLLLA